MKCTRRSRGCWDGSGRRCGEVTDLPARIGPAEFSILGGMIAVRCPHDLDDVMRRAGAAGSREPGNGLIERRRIGPVIRTLRRSTDSAVPAGLASIWTTADARLLIGRKRRHPRPHLLRFMNGRAQSAGMGERVMTHPELSMVSPTRPVEADGRLLPQRLDGQSLCTSTSTSAPMKSSSIGLSTPSPPWKLTPSPNERLALGFRMRTLHSWLTTKGPGLPCSIPSIPTTAARRRGSTSFGFSLGEWPKLADALRHHAIAHAYA